MFQTEQVCCRCSITSSSSQPQLTLDCSHSLCLYCLSDSLAQVQSQQALSDQLQLVCSTCNCLTQIDLALVLKIVRNVPKHNKNSNKMICMDCLDGLFDLEKYTEENKCKDHNVKSISKGFPLLKNILQYLGKQLSQNIDSLDSQTEQLYHYKDIMNDVITANVHRIRTIFKNLKQEINRKQQQTIEFYQVQAEKELNRIQSDIVRTRNHIEKGQQYLKWISKNVLYSLNSARTNQEEFCEYFMINHLSIASIGAFQELMSTHIPTYQDVVKKSQQSVSMQGLKKVLESLRDLQLIENQLNSKQNTSSDDSASTASELSCQYFENKRKQIIGPQQNTHLHHLLAEKIKGDPNRTKMDLIKQIYRPLNTVPKKHVKLPLGNRHFF